MEYTAIYSTESLKGVQYSFEAKDVNDAIAFAENKFAAFPNIAIIENDDDSRANHGLLVFLNGEVIR